MNAYIKFLPKSLDCTSYLNPSSIFVYQVDLKPNSIMPDTRLRQQIASLKAFNPLNVIPILESSIQEEEMTLQANIVLNNRIQVYEIKERIIDLKFLLSFLRDELRS